METPKIPTPVPIKYALRGLRTGAESIRAAINELGKDTAPFQLRVDLNTSLVEIERCYRVLSLMGYSEKDEDTNL